MRKFIFVFAIVAGCLVGFGMEQLAQLAFGQNSPYAIAIGILAGANTIFAILKYGLSYIR